MGGERGGREREIRRESQGERERERESGEGWVGRWVMKDRAGVGEEGWLLSIYCMTFPKNN